MILVRRGQPSPSPQRAAGRFPGDAAGFGYAAGLPLRLPRPARGRLRWRRPIMSAGRGRAKTRIYMAGPLGFSEAGRHFYNAVLIPFVQGLGYEVLDPWTLTEPAKIQAVQSMAYGLAKREAWRTLNLEIGATNRAAIDAARRRPGGARRHRRRQRHRGRDRLRVRARQAHRRLPGRLPAERRQRGRASSTSRSSTSSARAAAPSSSRYEDLEPASAPLRPASAERDRRPGGRA